MAQTPLIELVNERTNVKRNPHPRTGSDVRFYFKATSVEVTADKLNAMLDFIIQDLNQGWTAEFGEEKAFNTELHKNNLRIVNIAVGADKKLTFELSLEEVEFASATSQRSATNSILRTLNTALPHALKA